MLEDQVSAADVDKEALGKQNSKLLDSKNPQAKMQYLDGIRSELNLSRKEVIRHQTENKTLRREIEQGVKRV